MQSRGSAVACVISVASTHFGREGEPTRVSLGPKRWFARGGDWYTVRVPGRKETCDLMGVARRLYYESRVPLQGGLQSLPAGTRGAV